MQPTEIFLVAAASGAITALAPSIYLIYRNKPITPVTIAGALNSFVSGFVFALLALQWGFFYLRFTYLLALALLVASLAYNYWGMYRDRWQFYLFAVATWIYIVVVALLTRVLGLGDPFLI